MTASRLGCLLLTSGLALTGCAGATGEALRPDAVKAADAVDGSHAQCREVGESGQPLIVDWPAHERTNLEEAMLGGVAVVAYDCKELRLLKDCRLEGSYGFLGLTKREESLQLVDADEIRANLPAFGGKLVSTLGAELGRGKSLDLAMVMAGKSRTTVPRATRAQLQGNCEGATHFVRGAFVGAFAMSRGTRGAVRTSAELFGAGVSAASTSQRADQSREGEPDACGRVEPGDAKPPKGCRTAVRLELMAIAKDGAKAASETPAAEIRQETSCPTGMVRSEGKCAVPTPDKAHQCTGEDPADCEKQCAGGDVGSCYFVALMRESGQGLTQDFTKATKLYDQTCKQGLAQGCDRLGVMHFYGSGAEKNAARAVELFLLGCRAGLAAGCNNLGFVLDVGRGVKRDSTKAATLFQAACNGGSAPGCFNAGILADAGRGTARDAQVAQRMFERARQGGIIEDFTGGCEYGNAYSCFGLGYMHERGLYLPKDGAKARRYYEKSCPGVEWGCEALGH